MVDLIYRTMIRKHNLELVEYLCDMFRSIKKTAKEQLVDLLAHRWQLATVNCVSINSNDFFKS